MNEIEALSKAVEARYEDMVETLQRWIRIPSVKGEPAPGAPFGPQVREMLDAALADGRRLGLPVRDVDGYAGDFEIGEGEETVAILTHLDVVPAGDGWQGDPFGAQIEGGRLYGRGTCDNKGPSVAALFALRAVLDAGIPLGKKARLIFGCDEESGWEDMAYYREHIGMPPVGFSPDAEYPLINTEKGICHLHLRAQMPMEQQAAHPLYAIRSGERGNVIPGIATAEVGGDSGTLQAAAQRFADGHPVEVSLSEGQQGRACITVTGATGHAAFPEGGVNAASYLLRLLAEAGVGGVKTAPMIQTLAETAGGPFDGSGFGINGADGVSGPLTMNLGILGYDGAAWEMVLDIRYPVFFDGDQIRRFIEGRLSPMGFVLTPGHCQPPHHVPEDRPVVTELLSVYRMMTGDPGAPKAIGGGTYARALREGVAFGAGFPDEEELAHQAGENLRLDRLLLNAKIFAHAIVALCGA